MRHPGLSAEHALLRQGRSPSRSSTPTLDDIRVRATFSAPAASMVYGAHAPAGSRLQRATLGFSVQGAASSLCRIVILTVVVEQLLPMPIESCEGRDALRCANARCLLVGAGQRRRNAVRAWLTIQDARAHVAAKQQQAAQRFASACPSATATAPQHPTHTETRCEVRSSLTHLTMLHWFQALPNFRARPLCRGRPKCVRSPSAVFAH